MKQRHFFVCMTSLLAFAGPALAAGGAGSEAQTGSQFQMEMTLYAGGITLGKADMDATVRGAAIIIAVSNLQTSGLVNILWKGGNPGHGVGQGGSEKRVALALLTPTTLITPASGRKFRSPTTMPIRRASTPIPLSDTGYEVKPDDQKATFDPVSGMIFMVSGAGAGANPCDVTVPVFDGRRRYNIEVQKTKDMDIKMDNGLYSGPAMLCQIRYHQLAGYKNKILRENEKFPVINAWVVTYRSAAKGSDYMVPLRIWADTSYGRVSAVATALKIDGQIPKPAN